ncbi:MAG: hypothetical protein HY048_11885 [Acidobacteria bacterium]|nr:hypothetical protein [Acidobacteriota bacterium]
MRRPIFAALLCAIVMGLPAEALRGGQVIVQRPDTIQAPPAPPPPPPPPAPMPSVLRTYSAVDATRLTRPADGDWLMVRRTYDGWGYSQCLSEIR